MKTAHPALVRGTCLKARATGALAAPGLQKNTIQRKITYVSQTPTLNAYQGLQTSTHWVRNNPGQSLHPSTPRLLDAAPDQGYLGLLKNFFRRPPDLTRTQGNNHVNYTKSTKHQSKSYVSVPKSISSPQCPLKVVRAPLPLQPS